MNNTGRSILKTVLSICLMLALGACGGAGSDLQIANGVGGTGITMGKITRFDNRQIKVNGIDFNTDSASFTRDRVGSKTQRDFHTGEVVRVIGSVDKKTQTGIATEVIFSDTLEGPVTRIAEKNTITILEQTVITDQLTLFHGFNQLSDLKRGNVIEVSGFSDTQGNIRATSLTLVESSFTDGVLLSVEGPVSHLNREANTFRIYDLTISYASALFENIHADDLRNGLYLFVDADQNIRDGILTASTLFVPDDNLKAGDSVEIEGLVSTLVSPTHFDIEEFPVIATAQTRFINGAASDLELDRFMRVLGTINNQGAIVAEEITLLDFGVDFLSDIVIEATIEAIDLANETVTVLGQRIKVDGFTLLSNETTENFDAVRWDELAVGDSLFVVATPIIEEGTGKTVFIASRLSKIEAISSVFLSAVVESSDEQFTTLNLSGHLVNTDGLTKYHSAEGDETSAATFFALLENGVSLVSVTGSLQADGTILADSLDVEME